MRPTGLLITLCWLLCSGFPHAFASSHSDAPLIKLDPASDNTDLYAFLSYEPGRENHVTLIANFLPFQTPEGGPVFYNLNPDARYRIHIDNDGDAIEDKTFEFSFQTIQRDIQVPINGIPVSVPILNTGAVSPFSTGNLSLEQTYRVGLIHGSIGVISSTLEYLTNAGNGSEVFRKPVDNIGTKSIANYRSYSQAFIQTMNLPGGKGTGRVFVGQRDDPFYIDLGGVFDLLNITSPTGSPVQRQDDLDGKSITSMAIEVPIQFLVQEGNPVIGVWASAVVPTRGQGPDTNQDGIVNSKDLINVAGNYLRSVTSTISPFTQVSRLGNPLVNELIIGMKDKDRFNASRPKDDAQFQKYFTNPVVPFHIGFLTGQQPPNLFPRDDFKGFFLQGIPEVVGTPHGTLADLLRLNTSIAPTPRESQDPLGIFGGDPAGFPNGRRPGDDVVDIILRVAMGSRLPLSQAPAGQLTWTDGVRQTAEDFDTAFPYLTDPKAGED